MRIIRRVLFLGSMFAIAAVPLAAQAAMQMQMSPLMGSVPSGNISAQPLPLSLTDAIDRGLHYNLAALSGTQEEREAAAVRLKNLSELLPKVNASLTGTSEQLSLAAFGFSNFPGIPSVVGPFAIFDVRAFVSQSVVDRKLVHDLRQSEEDQRAVSFGNANTRELVVLVVANLYLQALADSSRITTVSAQVTRAQALYTRATDLKNNGVIPGIDLLRAQVELQTQQQHLLAIQNEFARQELTLERAIGVPLGQQIQLTDAMPQQGTPPATPEGALQTALANRADAKQAETLINSAQEAVNSSKSEKLPTLSFNANYGDIGMTAANSHGTYTVTGSLNVPIFNANHGKADEAAAQARLDQRRLEFEDLKSRIEMDIRSSFLDLHTSEEQVKVAQSSLDLARQELDQAQDRFESGVANNLEVVQAQEAVALANESLISGLYSLNVAKASLAHAMGVAEQSIKTILGGK